MNVERSRPQSAESVIHLTGRPPIRIVDAEWPVIARAIWHDGERPSSAKSRAYVRVREHEDGRAIVYGLRSVSGEVDRKSGILVEGDDADLRAAIVEVCGDVGIRAQDVFDDLPVEEL